MNKQKIKAIISNGGLLLVSAFLAGCPCTACDKLMCGDGTIEIMSDEVRTCTVAPVSCGDGAKEQTIGGQRECVPIALPADILECGAGTHEQEQTFGGQRECVLGATTCATAEVETVDADGNLGCKAVPFLCADGTFEQTIGGQRECVPDDTDLSCGTGTKEQTMGGQRECGPE